MKFAVKSPKQLYSWTYSAKKVHQTTNVTCDRRLQRADFLAANQALLHESTGPKTQSSLHWHPSRLLVHRTAATTVHTRRTQAKKTDYHRTCETCRAGSFPLCHPLHSPQISFSSYVDRVAPARSSSTSSENVSNPIMQWVSANQIAASA